MSRIGKKPILLPSGVTATLGNLSLEVKGPKGTLSLPLHKDVKVEVAPEAVTVSVDHPTVKKERSLWGLFRSLIQNMVLGVTEGYTKELDIVGVGFKADVQGQKLTLALGFSHPIIYELPVGITGKAEKKPERVTIQQYQTTLTLTGSDKQLLGQTAAEIRTLKKPEPYKGKGIKYSDEVILRKAGKALKAAGK